VPVSSAFCGKEWKKGIVDHSKMVISDKNGISGLHTIIWLGDF